MMAPTTVASGGMVTVPLATFGGLTEASIGDASWYFGKNGGHFPLRVNAGRFVRPALVEMMLIDRENRIGDFSLIGPGVGAAAPAASRLPKPKPKPTIVLIASCGKVARLTPLIFLSFICRKQL
jgi:hypothetical protein